MLGISVKVDNKVLFCLASRKGEQYTQELTRAAQIICMFHKDTALVGSSAEPNDIKEIGIIIDEVVDPILVGDVPESCDYNSLALFGYQCLAEIYYKQLSSDLPKKDALNEMFTIVQLSKMFHAVGRDPHAVPRNYYNAGGDVDNDWDDLVARSYAVCTRTETYGYNYHVSPKGIKVLKSIISG